MIMKKKSDRIQIPNCDSLEIYKQTRSKYYYVRFYVGLHHNKSGNFIKSLKTVSQQEAIKLAKDLWHSYYRKNPQDDEVDIEDTFNSVALKYFEHKEFMLSHSKSADEYFKKSNQQKDFEKAKYLYEHSIKKEFGGKNINLINTIQLEEFIFKLKQVYSGSHISSHKALLVDIFNFAHATKKIISVPKFPKVERKDDSYIPYTKDEINLITKKLRELAKVKPSTRSHLESYEHYNEVADIVNFLFHTPLRPGKEIYLQKHKDFNLLTNTRKEKFYAINPPHRKVEDKNQTIPTDDIFKEIYENRICVRYPNETSNEYIFFNNDKDRQAVARKVYKVFTKVSKLLNLYYVSNSRRNRPLYSIRSASFNAMKKHSNATYDEIASIGNTSEKMLKKRYMKNYYNDEVVALQEKLFKRS